MVLMHHTPYFSYNVQRLLLFWTPGGSTILQFWYYYLEHLAVFLSFMEMHLKENIRSTSFACAFFFHMSLCLFIWLIIIHCSFYLNCVIPFIPTNVSRISATIFKKIKTSKCNLYVHLLKYQSTFSIVPLLFWLTLYSFDSYTEHSDCVHAHWSIVCIYKIVDRFEHCRIWRVNRLKCYTCMHTYIHIINICMYKPTMVHTHKQPR